MQEIAEQWLRKPYSGLDVAYFADELRQCLTEAVLWGASQEMAKAECPPALYEPMITPGPTETPTPEPTPTPQARQVTAVGGITDASDPQTITANSITLRFSREGGSVTGQGHVEKTFSGKCKRADGTWIERTIVYAWDIVVLSGTYSDDTGKLEGTAQITHRHVTCQTGAKWTDEWSATLQDGRVVGRFLDDCDQLVRDYKWPDFTPSCLPGASDPFELTV